MGLKGVNASIQWTEKHLRDVLEKLDVLIDKTTAVELQTDQVNLNTDTLENKIQSLIDILKTHENYEHYDLTASTDWAEQILPLEFTSFAFSNSKDDTIFIKLNSDTGDPITLEKGGRISHTNFKINKFYYRSDKLSSASFSAFFSKAP